MRGPITTGISIKNRFRKLEPLLKQNPITEPFAGLSLVANLVLQKSTTSPTAKLSPIDAKLKKNHRI